MPLRATGWPSSNRSVTVSAVMPMFCRQNATPMIGSTMETPLLRYSRSFASCVAPSMFESVEYAFSALMRYVKPARCMYSDISRRPPSSSMKR